MTAEKLPALHKVIFYDAISPETITGKADYLVYLPIPSYPFELFPILKIYPYSVSIIVCSSPQATYSTSSILFTNYGFG